MAPVSRSKGGKTSKKATTSDGPIPKPYRSIPDALAPFVSVLNPKHVYITHIDYKPAAFKRKIFLVPVALNLAVVALFVLRVRYVYPYYHELLLAAAGHHVPGVSIDTVAHSWPALAWIVFRRGLTILLDLVLVIFVWPWPVEFALGRTHSNPVAWRLAVGFRDAEVYVRRGRSEWDGAVAEVDVLQDSSARGLLAAKVRAATAPMLLSEKTGYLTMNADWDLDWRAMVHAHRLADDKVIALDAFRLVVLLHHASHGWLVLDTGTGAGVGAKEEERRRQMFLFRDALSAVGKEDLFYRWIEIIQFETSQPGGFTPEKQVTVAGQIRELFQKSGVDFDEFWRESVGTEGLAGM